MGTHTYIYIKMAKKDQKKSTKDSKPRAQAIAVGLNRGHKLATRQLKARPAATKGKSTKRTKFVRELIREVSGFAPYEKRVMELLRNGLDKRALRASKRRLGTHHRALKKRSELMDAIK